MSLLKLKIMINVAYADCFTFITLCLVEVQSIARSVSLCRLSVSLNMCSMLSPFFTNSYVSVQYLRSLKCIFFTLSRLKCVDVAVKFKPTNPTTEFSLQCGALWILSLFPGQLSLLPSAGREMSTSQSAVTLGSKS